MRLASRDSILARASMSTPRSSSGGGSRSATARHLPTIVCTEAAHGVFQRRRIQLGGVGIMSPCSKRTEQPHLQEWQLLDRPVLCLTGFAARLAGPSLPAAHAAARKSARLGLHCHGSSMQRRTTVQPGRRSRREQADEAMGCAKS